MQNKKTEAPKSSLKSLIQKNRRALFIATAVVCGSSYVSAPVALVMGFLFTLLLGNPLPNMSSKATSLLLKISVIGLGFGMNAKQVAEAGKDGIWLTVCSITVVLTLGYLLGRLMKMDKRMSHLIASGTAICGGSAIAAVAPAIKAKPEEISIALGVIFLLNSIALIIFPPMGHFFELSQYDFGLWSAIAIHDTSSVVGAAATYGEEALQVATTVKLTRALWIIPVSLLSVFLFKAKGTKISIPWFIFLFVGAMLLNSFFNLEPVASDIYQTSKNLLVVTLFLIGSGISISSIKTTGLKPIFQGIILWAVISVLSLTTILYL